MEQLRQRPLTWTKDVFNVQGAWSSPYTLWSTERLSVLCIDNLPIERAVLSVIWERVEQLETVTSSQKLELIKNIQPRISDCFKSKWAMLQLSCLTYSWDYDIYFILCQHAAFDFDSASTQNNGPQINTSLYVDTTDKHVALRGHEDNLSLYLLLNDACLVEKQEIPRLVFGLTRPGMEPTIALEANLLTIAQSRRSASTKKGKSPHRTQRISYYQRPMK